MCPLRTVLSDPLPSISIKAAALGSVIANYLHGHKARHAGCSVQEQGFMLAMVGQKMRVLREKMRAGKKRRMGNQAALES